MRECRDHIAITLPAQVEWETYQRELEACARGGVLRFRVAQLPNKRVIGCRCYLVWKSLVRGWMEITNLVDTGFTCEVTGKYWAGKFIERGGLFHTLKNPVAMRGFQGFKYVQRVEND